MDHEGLGDKKETKDIPDGLGFYHPKDNNTPDKIEVPEGEKRELWVRLDKITERLTDPAIVSRWKSDKFEEILNKIREIRNDLGETAKPIPIDDLKDRIYQVEKLIDSGGKDIPIEGLPTLPKKVFVGLPHEELPNTPEGSENRPHELEGLPRPLPPDFTRFDGSELPGETNNNLTEIVNNINRQYDQALAELKNKEHNLLTEKANKMRKLAEIANLYRKVDELMADLK